ncbi:RNA polymerase sigma factor [Alteromonas oceanisediminis]|uniref:RNA polymerase sigma factor n=1 Tax=Alteromonas oceanisediminis TaxID=2836180 RepID=UPI001BDAA521|nr:RNA polymerase sigma factor [Alteromonas oceanisediminis]MBT0585138.1 RNA polymerase sigma factor [Alteromonas oceanisediminis]
MFEKSDEKLIAKALAGNKSAWFSLINRYEKSVYHYGVRMTGSHHDAADLMQDIFISVFRNLSSYQGTGAFKSWLFRIAHFRCIEFYRRKRPLVSLDECPDVSEQDPGLTPEVAMMGDQSQRHLMQAMQSLPVNQRAVVELKYFGQFTFDEIADQMGLSSNTVKSRLYSALAKLKQSLEVEYV